MSIPSRARHEVSQDRFRSLMASFPTGVAIVTTFGPDGRPRGMTCASVSSVSLSPPMLLVCLRHASRTLEAILLRAEFAVNLLHDGGAHTAKLFASSVPDRFDRIHWTGAAGTAGPHLTDDAHMVADCWVSRTQVAGDHVVVFGGVFAVSQGIRRPPLLYGLRRFAGWPGEPEPESSHPISGKE